MSISEAFIPKSLSGGGPAGAGGGAGEQPKENCIRSKLQKKQNKITKIVDGNFKITFLCNK